MANDFSANPWSLDTVSTAVVTTFWSTQAKISHAEFIDYNADTDVAELQDVNGKSIWKANGASDLRPIVSGKIGWVRGIKLTSITAGKVRVYLEP